MTKKIKDLKAVEVSLAAAPAQMQTFLITKEDDPMAGLSEVIEKGNLSRPEQVESVLKDAKPEVAAAVKGAMKLLEHVRKELTDEQLQGVADLVQIQKEHDDYQYGSAYAAPKKPITKQEIAKANELGAFIKAEMAAKKVTAEALAKAAGIDESTVGQILCGEIMMSPDRRMRGFSRALGTPMDKLKSLLPSEEVVNKEGSMSVESILKEDGSLNLEAVPEGSRAAVKALWDQNQTAIKKAGDLEKVVKEQRDAAVLLEKVVKEQRDIAVLKECVERAGTFKNLPGVAPAEFGAVLKDLQDKAPESLAKIETVLKAADAAIKEGLVFKEMGRGGMPGPTSADAEIDQSVTKIMKENTALTKEQAEAAYFQTPAGKALYSRMMNQPRQAN
jgi:transcriptional regulator with XRE-family HTH domain